jgi:hypothetical protein
VADRPDHRSWHHCLVGLHRGRDVGVPEDHLGIAGRHVQLLEQRRGVPEMVDLDHAQVAVVADPAPHS